MQPFLPIGPLPFGDKRAHSIESVQLGAERVARAMPSLQDYESRSKYFRYKSATLAINGLELYAFATSPTFIRFGEMNYRQNGEVFVSIPFAGLARGESEGQVFPFMAGHKGLSFSETRGVEWTGETRSQLLLKLNINRLSLAAASMIGADNAEGLLDITRGASLALRAGGVDFSQAFRSICNLIDANVDKVSALEMLSIDDLVYRQCIFLLKPELLVREDGRSTRWNSGRPAVIDELCDTIKARFDRPLSLTEMEKITGLSARTIQYAFRSRFGCSPMQWQRRERLLFAYKALSGAREDVSMTQLAHACGYLSLPAFSTDYRKLFGETPSHTLSGSRRKTSAAEHQQNSLTNRSRD